MVRAINLSIGDKAISPLAKIRLHLIEAVNAHMVTISYTTCMDAVKKGIAEAEDNGVHLLDIPLYQTGAYAAIIEHKHEETKGFIKKMLPLIKTYSYFDIGDCSSIQLSIDLLNKNYFSALIHAFQTIRMAFKTASPIPIFLTHTGMAQSLLNMGRFKTASDQIKKARYIAKSIKEFKLIFMVLAAEAYMHLKRGDERAIDALEKAMAIGAEQNILNLLHWDSDMMSVLCAKALEHDIETEYVKSLIRKRNLVPPSDFNPSSLLPLGREGMSRVTIHWPYPLKIFTLGPFEIMKDDAPVSFSGRVQQKPLDLVKAIIAFGGIDVPCLKLMDALWPEADADKASQSLKFTLHALRKLLGGDIFIRLKEGYEP